MTDKNLTIDHCYDCGASLDDVVLRIMRRDGEIGLWCEHCIACADDLVSPDVDPELLELYTEQAWVEYRALIEGHGAALASAMGGAR